jgi:hypothetical protein
VHCSIHCCYILFHYRAAWAVAIHLVQREDIQVVAENEEAVVAVVAASSAKDLKG